MSYQDRYIFSLVSGLALMLCVACAKTQRSSLQQVQSNVHSQQDGASDDNNGNYLNAVHDAMSNQPRYYFYDPKAKEDNNQTQMVSSDTSDTETSQNETIKKDFCYLQECTYLYVIEKKPDETVYTGYIYKRDLKADSTQKQLGNLQQYVEIYQYPSKVFSIEHLKEIIPDPTLKDTSA